jgi:hypothetical protein
MKNHNNWFNLKNNNNLKTEWIMKTKEIIQSYL